MSFFPFLNTLMWLYGPPPSMLFICILTTYWQVIWSVPASPATIFFQPRSKKTNLSQFSTTTTNTFSLFQLRELSEAYEVHSRALKLLFYIFLKNIARGLGTSTKSSWESAVYSAYCPSHWKQVMILTHPKASLRLVSL